MNTKLKSPILSFTGIKLGKIIVSWNACCGDVEKFENSHTSSNTIEAYTAKIVSLLPPAELSFLGVFKPELLQKTLKRNMEPFKSFAVQKYLLLEWQTPYPETFTSVQHDYASLERQDSDMYRIMDLGNPYKQEGVVCIHESNKKLVDILDGLLDTLISRDRMISIDVLSKLKNNEWVKLKGANWVHLPKQYNLVSTPCYPSHIW